MILLMVLMVFQKILSAQMPLLLHQMTQRTSFNSIYQDLGGVAQELQVSLVGRG
jgi:hypothetical protein